MTEFHHVGSQLHRHFLQMEVMKGCVNARDSCPWLFLDAFGPGSGRYLAPGLFCAGMALWKVAIAPCSNLVGSTIKKVS